MSYNQNNEQKVKGKAFNDLSGYLPTSLGGKIENLSVIMALLKSQDKLGNYHIRSMEQALDMIPEPLVVTSQVKVINGKKVSYKDEVTCLDSQEVQHERWELVKAIYRTFSSPNTGFPEYLANKYQPRFNAKQLTDLIAKELEHNNPAIRSRSHAMIGY